jgi:hypothetical protein
MVRLRRSKRVMTMSDDVVADSTPRTRSLLIAGGRASLALVAAAAGAALVAGVVLVPGPTLTPTVPTVAVTPDRSDQSLVCAGGALGLTRGDDPQVAVVASEQRHTSGAGLVTSTLAVSDAVDGSAVVVTLPREAPGDALAATAIVSPDTADVSGLAASECLSPARTSWLVGGSTTVGRTTWIVLSNADAVDAAVDLTLWGDAGLIDAGGTTGIIVAAGTQRIVPLAGIAVDQPSPVVRVSSTGGSVAATLQTSVVRGLTPSGISIVTPLAEPAVRHVIAALPVINGQVALERSTADGGADGLPALRLLAPGETAAQVSVRFVSADGGVGLVTEATLEPGVVLDLPVTNLADGDYGVIVDASEPVVVAGRTSTAGTSADGVETADLEWFVPSPALAAGSDVLIAVAPVDTAQLAFLHVMAPAGAAEVTIDGVPVSIAAGGMVVVPSPADAGVRLTTSGVVHVSVSYRGDGLLAGSRVLAPPSAASALTVLPQ